MPNSHYPGIIYQPFSAVADDFCYFNSVARL
jgi:hypothetical protein